MCTRTVGSGGQAELGYLHVLVAGHGSMLAVMQGWILLHSCVTSVTEMS